MHKKHTDHLIMATMAATAVLMAAYLGHHIASTTYTAIVAVYETLQMMAK